MDIKTIVLAAIAALSMKTAVAFVIRKIMKKNETRWKLTLQSIVAMCTDVGVFLVAAMLKNNDILFGTADGILLGIMAHTLILLKTLPEKHQEVKKDI